jgi:hypothetical protein
MIQEAEECFDALVAEFGRKVVKLKMDSAGARAWLAGSFVDAVYIDAGHTYQACFRDIVMMRDLVRPGGFVSGHDWRPEMFPGVLAAVRDLLGEPDKVFPDSSWVKQWPCIKQKGSPLL